MSTTHTNAWASNPAAEACNPVPNRPKRFLQGVGAASGLRASASENFWVCVCSKIWLPRRFAILYFDLMGNI